MNPYVIRTTSGNLGLSISPQELTLPLAELRTRIFDPARAVFVARFPDEAAEYDANEGALICSLGLANG